MELPHDIEQRLERRWLARYLQDFHIRQEKKVVNEAEVTNQKAELEITARHSIGSKPS
jgi:hypothetical protein